MENSLCVRTPVEAGDQQLEPELEMEDEEEMDQKQGRRPLRVRKPNSKYCGPLSAVYILWLSPFF
ncbi:hypothetical protein E2562_012838 [Oryza meyeriana var. granulata]|uniref:Uncharacterized protein n=1 Tax=Oryza meyeriana var. granulata TaxID=110450 RepID=A0A6G1CPG5_9ORYZ|nr:hypothetical protein E2562_012838 [Oryza meyeriana var. granulata]